MKVRIKSSFLLLPIFSIFVEAAFTGNGQSVTEATKTVRQCPVDWVNAGQLGCYKLLTQAHNLSWIESENECERLGGHLAEPKSIEKARFLYSFTAVMKNTTDIHAWYIGLSDFGSEERWEWIHSKEPVTYSHWTDNSPLTGEPNLADCVIMELGEKEFWWKDVSCFTPNKQNAHPICQMDLDNASPIRRTTVAPTVKPKGCPSSYTKFNDHCYKFVSDSSHSWVTAENYCRKEGGHLASVHSQAENDFITKLAGNENYWLGGHPDSHTTGWNGWLWSDGTDWDFMHKGENYDSQKCLYYRATDRAWTTRTCYDRRKWTRYQQPVYIYFICKI